MLSLIHFVCLFFFISIDYTGLLDRVVKITHVNVDKLNVGNSTYADQFRDAMNVNGGDVENATTIDYVMHFFTFGFKVKTATFMMSRRT